MKTNDSQVALWIRILEKLYERGYVHSGGWELPDRSKENVVETLAADLEEDQEDVQDSVDKMVDMYQVADWEYEKNDYSGLSVVKLSLTKKGFDIAHDHRTQERRLEWEIRQEKRHHKVNRAIALLTLGLVFVGIVEASVTGLVGKESPLWQVNGVLVFGVGFILIIGWALYEANLLQPWEKIE
jgi:hypothetical protein